MSTPTYGVVCWRGPDGTEGRGPVDTYLRACRVVLIRRAWHPDTAWWAEAVSPCPEGWTDAQGTRWDAYASRRNGCESLVVSCRLCTWWLAFALPRGYDAASKGAEIDDDLVRHLDVHMGDLLGEIDACLGSEHQ